jgi:N6-L-threonylcarbamoyladenine synthase
VLVLGIETSCDDTGVALYAAQDRMERPSAGLLAHALHSQVSMHADFGGVVPELASRDHIRRVLPLVRQLMSQTGHGVQDLDGIAYTKGPGLAGALLVGASIASAMGYALGIPTIGVHHLEGHLLSPLLSGDPPRLPFIALLVSGGHTQLMRVDNIGCYTLLGETVDDAAGEAFDKTAQLLGLGYPGGPAVSRLAKLGNPSRFKLPRPMLGSPDLNFSFSGLKTAVLTTLRQSPGDKQARADLAAAAEAAIVDVLVAGGVGANWHLRARLSEEAGRHGFSVHYPELQFCTDNGAMIAFAGAMRLRHTSKRDSSFTVRARWDLEELEPAGSG